jgi:hypothetical protein
MGVRQAQNWEASATCEVHVTVSKLSYKTDLESTYVMFHIRYQIPINVLFFVIS